MDVREPKKWAQGLLPGALRLPLSRLKALPLYLEREQPVPLCRSSNRSREARQIPQNLGRPKVWHLEGGLKTWYEADIPCASAV